MKSVQVGLFSIPLLFGLWEISAYGQRTSHAADEPPSSGLPWDFRTFADPQRFFQQFFGPDTEADRQTLERTEISLAEERNFGNQAAQAFLAELRRQKIVVVSRGKDIDYLRRLVAIVQAKMEHRERYSAWQIYIAEADPLEAKCFPGGALIFFRGMMDAAHSEAALIAVVGHELSHVDHGHQLNTMRRLKIAQQSLSGSGAGDPRQFLKNGPLFMRAFMRPFRPEDETVADLDATRWTFQLGYDPRELAGLLGRMGQSRPATSFLPSFLQSHPPTADRIRAVLDTCDRLIAESPGARLYVGAENLRRRITRTEREFAE